MSAFNSYDDDGRVTTVLLHAQHACEMLLKAILAQNKEPIFDKKTGKSIGFERCLGICAAKYDLSEQEAGVMRAIDQLRDAAQHWFVFVAEDILYLNIRALITAFDEYMKRRLDDELSAHIPPRVLPVSTIPPGDFEFLVDREYHVIADLLQGADKAPVDLVGVSAEMVVAEGLQALQHHVGLGLDGHEYVEGFGIFGGAAGGHGVVSGAELHRSGAIAITPAGR